MKKLIHLLLFFFSLSLCGQNGPTSPLSVRSNGVANASVAFNDINSLFNNQAGLADLENIGIIFSGEQSFRTPNSDNHGGGFAIPIASGAVGAHFHHFAFTDLWYSKIGLAYARKLSGKLSLGIQFDLLNIRFSEKKKRNLLSGQVGFQYKLNEKLLLGIHITNPIKLKIIEDEFLSRVIRVGATYAVLKRLLVHVELEKDLGFPIVFKSGIECELVDDLWIRIGFQNKPSTFNFGFGYRIRKRFRLEIATYYQQGIDWTPKSLLGIGFIPSVGFGFDFL